MNVRVVSWEMELYGMQHIRAKKCFVLKLFLRAVRGLVTEKGEKIPLLSPFFIDV